MKAPAWKWFIEFTHPTQAHMHGISRYIYSGQTRYQFVEIIETDFYGRCLVLDGKIQSAQHDEYIYHETLIHPAMVLHDKPEKILVLGGGEGAALREILKHPSVKKVVMVDLDKEVIEICQKYLPAWSAGAFKDSRVQTVFMDAREFINNMQEKWDIIFMDLTEPIDGGPSYLLFTKEFFQILAGKMSEESILALQAGSFNPKLLECHSAVYNTLKTAFSQIRSYASFIPSYDVNWGFITASRGKDPLSLKAAVIDDILKKRHIDDLKYYDGETHSGIFAVPKDIRKIRDSESRIIADNNPLTTY